MFADRCQWTLKTNTISALLNVLRAEGKTIVDLTESNPTRCGFNIPVPKILASFDNPRNLSYEPAAQGHLSAREAICAYYRQQNINIQPQQIFLTASTSEAYSYLFRLLTNPQERILFPQPSYPLFPFLVDLNDLQFDSYPLVYKDRWQMDLESFSLKFSSRVGALVLVNPNNPTGSYISSEELKTINTVCRQQQTPIICDEVFFDFSLTADAEAASLINNQENLTFVLGGLSKTLGLPQMKLSWIIISGPESQVQEATQRLEIIADTYLSVNTPVQNALPQWLALAPDIQQEMIQRLKENQSTLIQALQTNPQIQYLSSAGGWYAVLQLPAGINEEQWALNFLKEEGVYVHPGYFFDFVTEPFIVLSLLPQTSVFKTGVQRIMEHTQAAVNRVG